MKNNPQLLAVIILAVAIVAGFFVYPKSTSEWHPWRLGLDLVGGSHLVYEVNLSQVVDADRGLVLNGLRDVIEKRVNLFGVSEPQVFVARAGEKSQLIVELAGVKKISEAIQEIGTTPFLDFRTVQQNGSTTTFLATDLNGRHITGAQVSFDNTTRSPQVSLSFNSDGAKLFEDLTAQLAPTAEHPDGLPLAIFLDNNLIEMPLVKSKISGGNAVISGRFTMEQAKQLAERFNAGALPAPITLINQQTVSPTLGLDSFRATLIAGALGTLIVILFMLFYYGRLGIFASLALLIYIALTLAIFKLVPITLSLAGLAGFIITIGMAVDANILVFERMKEELKKGLTGLSAVEEGFRRAWPSIRDSNVSTIITAVILYFLTTSFVRGFALTLLIGVLISMFSAITTTRIFLRVFSGRRKGANSR
ncbi:MAG: protein translocase subunit SecD [Candidatus Liptonbacteria bacterium]|nr:protein translocase subunit SecD [Candidatus Liptonbacteria bacterium]